MKPVPAPGKPRKPYTITKSRESWTDAEHNMFLEAINLCVSRLRPNLHPPVTLGKQDAESPRALLGADAAPASPSARRYDRDWKQIEKYVGTKTVIQIRSHAQKYFLKVRARPATPPLPPPVKIAANWRVTRDERRKKMKLSRRRPPRLLPSRHRPTSSSQVQKNGTGEHIPPPRPKRKSTQPYPQKSASEKAAASRGKSAGSRGAANGNSSRGPMAPPPPQMAYPHGMGGYPMGSNGPGPGPGSMGAGGAVWVRMSDGMGIQMEGARNGAGMGGAGVPYGHLGGGMGGGKGGPRGHGPGPGPGPGGKSVSNPDFVCVYSFLAGLFDPEMRGHREKLRAMSAIDRETTMLLMRNLGANLMCQRMWEDQIQLIGAGFPTFVNAAFDEPGRGMMGGSGGPQVMQASAVGGTGRDNSNGSSDGRDGNAANGRSGDGGSGGNSAGGEGTPPEFAAAAAATPPPLSNWSDQYVAAGAPTSRGEDADGASGGIFN